MAAEWTWIRGSVLQNAGDSHSGTQQTDVPIPAGASVQRVITHSGWWAFYAVEHTAPGAGRIGAAYRMEISVRITGAFTTPYTLIRRDDLCVPTNQSVDTASGAQTSNLITWRMPFGWWEIDINARHAFPSGGNVTFFQTWQAEGDEMDNVDQLPSTGWSGEWDYLILTCS